MPENRGVAAGVAVVIAAAKNRMDELFEKGLLPYSWLDARIHDGGNPIRLSASC
jgi:hypothetical protein